LGLDRPLWGGVFVFFFFFFFFRGDLCVFSVNANLVLCYTNFTKG